MNSVYECICSRRSIRRFKNKPIEEDLLIKLVNAGRLAPSGANIQPLEFVLVNDPSHVDKLFPYLKWAGYIAPAGNPPDGEHPVAYCVVLVDVGKKKKGGEVDAAAAISTILLTAWFLGIGSCWLGAINRKQIKKLLKIPHHLHVDSVIALGYPNEKPVLEDAGESIQYWKDQSNTLHVPKRKIETILHKNGYGVFNKKLDDRT